jgi:hypothetical protein
MTSLKSPPRLGLVYVLLRLNILTAYILQGLTEVIKKIHGSPQNRFSVSQKDNMSLFFLSSRNIL